jgi:hypothetical protein
MQRSILCPLKLRLALILSVCIFVGSANPQQTPKHLDSSDWWSYTRQEELPLNQPRQPIEFQNRKPGETSFQVAGITLGERWDFSDVRSKFGNASKVQRGDAASGRDQICYLSSSGNVHLIFELGEVGALAYLFEDGPKWNGSELCATSKAVSEQTSTASGLRLGLEPEQVKKILGDPSIGSPSKLIYYFGYKEKTPPETLTQLRKDHSQMNDAEFRKNYEYAEGEAYIEARFALGKLNYLAISKSETY